jgi:hypothetical protein
MQKFELELKNEKIKAYRTITLLIVILNILVFTFLLFDPTKRTSALASLIFIFLYSLYRFYIGRKKQHAFYLDEWIFFLLMILWTDAVLVSIINMVLFLLYTISLQKSIYEFDSSFIKRRNFPWKKYQWQQLNNVILKDNLLTIDFKSNKLLQAEITNDDINEKQFNNFAKEQLDLSITRQ